MEQLRQSTPTARKTHRCDWCGLEIKLGEKYERSTNIFDGILFDWKNHISCRMIASELRMFDYVDEGLSEDDFIEAIYQAYDCIMQETNPELYESEEFRMPTFADQLDFVKKHYDIKTQKQ